MRKLNIIQNFLSRIYSLIKLLITLIFTNSSTGINDNKHLVDQIFLFLNFNKIKIYNLKEKVKKKIFFTSLLS